MKDIEEIKWLWKKTGSRGIIRLDYKEGLLLGKYASLVNGSIVEIGTHKGGSAYLLAYFANNNNRIITVDVHGLYRDDNVDMYKKLKEFKPPVTIIQADSRSFYSPIIRPATRSLLSLPVKNYDLLFIDGRHRLESVLSDTNRFWNNCNQYIAYHDYTHAIGVTEVVDFLLKNKICTKLEQQGSMIVLKKEINLKTSIAL